MTLCHAVRADVNDSVIFTDTVYMNIQGGGVEIRSIHGRRELGAFVRFPSSLYRSDENFLWIMDEEVQNSFKLRSSDVLLDIKLLQLFKLFNKTIDVGLFGEIDFDA